MIGLFGYIKGERQYVFDQKEIDRARADGVPLPEKIPLNFYTEKSRRKGGLIFFDRGLKSPYGHATLTLSIEQKPRGFCVFLDGWLLKIAIWPYGFIELTPRWVKFS